MSRNGRLVGVDIQNRNGDTAIHGGFRGKMGTEVLEMLLSAGANVHIRNFKGRSQLHDAVKFSAIGMPGIDMMIANGASVNAIDDEGSSVLHDALKNPNVTTEIIHKLLKYGAYPDSRDSKKQPPLAFVEESKLSLDEKRAIAKLLIQCTVIENPTQISENDGDEVLCLHFCKNLLKRKEWANIRDSCITEIIQMRNEYIYKNFTLIALIYRQLRKMTSDMQLDYKAVRKMCSWLGKNKYPTFQDVIFSSVPNYELKEFARRELHIYSHKPFIFLDSECVYKICSFLSNIDMMNLIIASFMNDKTCQNQKFQDCEPHSVKRVAEEIAYEYENISKKTKVDF